MHFVLQRYAPKGLSWRADYAEYESHGTTQIIGQYIALRKFFTNWDKPWNDIDSWGEFSNVGGLETILERFRGLSKEYGYTVKPQGLNSVGWFYLKEKRLKEAIEVFLLNKEYFPHSAETFQGLAKAYDADGQIESALSAVNMAYELARSGNDKERFESITIHRRKLRLR